MSEQERREQAQEQERMESFLRQKVEENLTDQKDRINGMISPAFVRCSAEEKLSVMHYPVQDWETNRYGIIHGGMVTTMMDNAMAMMGLYLSPTGFTTTVASDIKFLAPAKIGDTMEVVTKATHSGKRLLHLAGTMVSCETGKTIATCSAVFMHVAGAPEPKG